MVVEPIHCPTCQGTDVVKHGKTSDGKQRFRCQNATCTTVTFIRDYVYQGRLPAVKQQIIDMSLKRVAFAISHGYCISVQLLYCTN